MNIKWSWRSAHVLVIVCGLGASAVSAGGGNAPGNAPREDDAGRPAPAGRPSDQGQVPPVDAPRPPTANECIGDRADFKDTRGQALFVIELTNACDKRIRCVIDAYVTTAKGPTSGHAVLTVPGKAGAMKSHAMKIGQSSGMANTSRACGFL
jgi:hypothetical protein